MSTTTVTRRRPLLGWLALGAAILVVGLLGAAVAGQSWEPKDAFDPDSAGERGTRALVALLRQGGVDVQVARSRAEATDALDRAEGAGLLVLPDTPFLSDEAVAALAAAAADVVLVEPRGRTLDLLIPGAALSGRAAEDVGAPACDLPDARRAGPATLGQLLTAGPGAGTVSCYPAGDGAGLLLSPHGASGRAVALDGTSVLVNARLAEQGNAALALNLLGARPTVVWYVPSPEDSDLAASAPSLGQLTPGWVSPAVALLLLAAVAAAIWRGRRFGPLVRERMPVLVHAGETVEGRARLYRRGRDHLHAADLLRAGALSRLADLLGMGAAADARAIADAAAATASADRARVHGVLLDDLPADESALIALGHALDDLEAAVRSAIHEEGSPR